MLLFFDIDGTLLDEYTFTVPQSSIEAINLAKENGHLCFINTGRPISTIDHIIKEIGFDGYVCGCGTYVELHNQVIFHNELQQVLRQELIQMIYDCHLEAVLEGINGAYFPDNIKKPLIQGMYKRYQDMGFHVSIYHKEDDIQFDKFAFWFDENSDVDTFINRYKDQFTFIKRDHDFYEVVPTPYSKASGIQKLCQHLNIPKSETISFGDSTNDLDMLKYTNYSVAMKESHPDVYKHVTYTTTSIKDNGIYNALKYYKII